MLVLASLSPASTAAEHELTEGVVLAVGVQQGTLLLETEDGYLLAAVDPNAIIESPRGGKGGLADLHSGDVVEYRADSFAGIMILRELHVIAESEVHGR